MTEHEDRVRGAVAAARAVAGAHGIAVDEPRVLHDGANVVVHLHPAPLVARVGTLTRLLRDGTTSFAREVSLASALAATGAPVVPPSDLLPPGPHEHAGTVLSFWPYQELRPEGAAPEQAARAWTELRGHLDAIDAHRAAAGHPARRPRGVRRARPALGRRRRVLAPASARLGELRGPLDGEMRQLHGDAHPGNLLATREAGCWADLEDCCSGPVQWDLVALRTTRRLDGRAALDAFPGAPTDDELRPWLELRALHVRRVVRGDRPRPPGGTEEAAARIAWYHADLRSARRPAATAGSSTTVNSARGSCSVAGGRAAARGTTRSHRAGRRCGSSSRPSNR